MPQWLRLVSRFVHAPLQHVMSGSQVFPHEPQLSSSSVSVVHVPSQQVSEPAQLVPQLPQ